MVIGDQLPIFIGNKWIIVGERLDCSCYWYMEEMFDAG